MCIRDSVAVCSIFANAAARFARKTKKDAAPARTVAATPINVKMLALRLRAIAESDLPKHAEQARRAGVEANNSAAAVIILFINS